MISSWNMTYIHRHTELEGALSEYLQWNGAPMVTNVAIYSFVHSRFSKKKSSLNNLLRIPEIS